MAENRSIFSVTLCAAMFLCLVELVHANGSSGVSDVEPNWTLILLVFIISSAIAALVGIVTLARDPYVPEPPIFSNPTFLDTEPDVPMSPQGSYPVMTTYRQFPMEYGSDSYPMDAMQSRNTEERRPSNLRQPPIMITTQKM